jgi:hypothetical protein
MNGTWCQGKPGFFDDGNRPHAGLATSIDWNGFTLRAVSNPPVPAHQAAIETPIVHHMNVTPCNFYNTSEGIACFSNVSRFDF